MYRVMDKFYYHEVGATEGVYSLHQYSFLHFRPRYLEIPAEIIYAFYLFIYSHSSNHMFKNCGVCNMSTTPIAPPPRTIKRICWEVTIYMYLQNYILVAYVSAL